MLTDNSSDLATMIVTTSVINDPTSDTVEGVSMKIIPDSVDGTLGTSGLYSSLLISNNAVALSEFDREMYDSNLLHSTSFNNENVTFQNTNIHTLTNTSAPIQFQATTADALGNTKTANSNNLLPYITSADSLSCTEKPPNTDYQLTDYALFQSVIQNSIFEGFGAYSTTQGFQQNLVNLLMTDDSQLFGGYNFGTSTQLPLIMFDVTRQFLNSKLKLRWHNNASQNSIKDGELDKTLISMSPTDDCLSTCISMTSDVTTVQQVAKMNKYIQYHDYSAYYDELHKIENISMTGLKGKDAYYAKGDNSCLNYMEKGDEEAGGGDPTFGTGDYIEITMEEVRRELFKTLACPELFGMIFFDQTPVHIKDGPTCGLESDSEFNYDQDNVQTWKGGQIRISNINEARLWLLQYRNWLIQKLSEFRISNKIRRSTHPLLRKIDDASEFLYTLDSFTIALISGGATLPDLYSKSMNQYNQTVENTTDCNDTKGETLKNCGLLQNRDFLRWAHLGTNPVSANTTTSGISIDQQTNGFGFGYQVGETDFQMSTNSNVSSLKDKYELDTPTGITSSRFQYRNTDPTIFTDTYLSSVNLQPKNREFNGDSNITFHTYETDLVNKWWEDKVCGGIRREWVLPVNIKVTTSNNISVNTFYKDLLTTSELPPLNSDVNVTNSKNEIFAGFKDRGNPGFLTNDVFNVSNWAWAKYLQKGNHASDDSGHNKSNIDDFAVGLNIAERDSTLKEDNYNKAYESEFRSPNLIDPRKITRTFSHNSFGASIKILDPVRQLHEATTKSTHATWVCNRSGRVIKNNGNAITIERRFGYGFCLGDLISVGQSHHFNLGSRITTNTKRRAAHGRKNHNTNIPVEFNAVVNCEFAIAFNVVDRCVGRFNYVDEDLDQATDIEGNVDNYSALLVDAINNNHELSIDDANIFKETLTSHSGKYIDYLSELYNDVYNTCLLNLATRRSANSLLANSIDITQKSISLEEEFIFNTDINESAEDFYCSGTDGHSLRKDFDGNSNFNNAEDVNGSNLLFNTDYPDKDNNEIVVTFNGGEEVNPKYDFLNLWFTFVPANNTYLVNNSVNIVNYKTDSKSISPSAGSDLVDRALFVPVWNTSILRHRSEYSDTIIRGTEQCPIDPDLQAGILIQQDQIITYDSDVTSLTMTYSDQPNPLLRDVDNNTDFSVGTRFVPQGTLLAQTEYDEVQPLNGVVLTGNVETTSSAQEAELTNNSV